MLIVKMKVKNRNVYISFKIPSWKFQWLSLLTVWHILLKIIYFWGWSGGARGKASIDVAHSPQKKIIYFCLKYIDILMALKKEIKTILIKFLFSISFLVQITFLFLIIAENLHYWLLINYFPKNGHRCCLQYFTHTYKVPDFMPTDILNHKLKIYLTNF